MCFSSGSSKPPPPTPPTRFEYSNNTDSVARQAAQYEAKGYKNTAGYGSELSQGSQTAQVPAAAPAKTGGM